MIVGDQFQADLLALIPRLRAFAHLLTKNPADADDLLQDTLLRAMKNRHQFQEGTILRAWVMTIMRNSFFSGLRKTRHEVSAEQFDIPTAHIPDVASPADSLALSELRRALDALPPEQREALLLVSVMDYSLQEAAAICRCAEGTIKSRVSRARDKLALMLGEERRPLHPSNRASRIGMSLRTALDGEVLEEMAA